MTRDEYSKVEYTEHLVRLTLDRLIIHKRPGLKINESQNMEKIKSNNSVCYELHLQNLSEVEYLDSKKMLLIYEYEKKL